jgi:hypothetical protein
VLRFKFSALMLGRQKRLILLVEKDQQVLQMCKTIVWSTGCAVFFPAIRLVFQIFPARWYHCLW